MLGAGSQSVAADAVSDGPGPYSTDHYCVNYRQPRADVPERKRHPSLATVAVPGVPCDSEAVGRPSEHTMSARRMQVERWERLTEAGDPSLQNFSLGPSPGGAATELGISRQAVHEAIQRGDLEALAVYKGTRLLFYTISRSSLERFKAIRAARRRA